MALREKTLARIAGTSCHVRQDGPVTAPAAPLPFTVGIPTAIAHRGGLAHQAENSRPALEAMLELGVRVLETDVRATSDGEVVLAHDPSLERRFGDPREIAEISWDELSGLRDHDDASPLRLEDVLAEYSELVLNIDAKSDDVVSPLMRIVRDPEVRPRVCLAAFSARRVALMRRISGDRVMTGMGMADVARLLAVSRVPGPAPRDVTPRAVQVPLTFHGVTVITPRFLDAAHSRGHVVHVWVVNKAEEMHRLLDLGVDGIVSDDLPVLSQVFRARGLALAQP